MTGMNKPHHYLLDVFFPKGKPISSMAELGHFYGHMLEAAEAIRKAAGRADTVNLTRLTMLFCDGNMRVLPELYNKYPTVFYPPAVACLMLGVSWKSLETHLKSITIRPDLLPKDWDQDGIAGDAEER